MNYNETCLDLNDPLRLTEGGNNIFEGNFIERIKNLKLKDMKSKDYLFYLISVAAFNVFLFFLFTTIFYFNVEEKFLLNFTHLNLLICCMNVVIFYLSFIYLKHYSKKNNPETNIRAVSIVCRSFLVFIIIDLIFIIIITIFAANGLLENFFYSK
ncbi:hypothetical protein GVAV_001003 [Gurleya vavrai]